MDGELSTRQGTILKFVIQEYVRTGRAVGSKALIERYNLGVSPATVRNEMGTLEEQSYLHHLHTSAGRVPTDRGYRYYVEYLLDNTQLPAPEQIMIQHQFRQVETQFESWARLAASILAEASGNVSLVTPPRSAVHRLRHFELISLRDHVVLLILVTQSGAVHQVIWQLTEPIDQETLSDLSRRLNPVLRNRTYEEIANLITGTAAPAATVIRHVAEALETAEQRSQSEFFTEGLDRALHQPEFSQTAVAQRLLELLRGGAILSALLPQVEHAEEVQIFIGSENRSEELRPFGIVVSTYGAAEEATGILGVVGPTRMPYGRSISAVRYLAQLLSDLLGNIYDDEDRKSR